LLRDVYLNVMSTVKQGSHSKLLMLKVNCKKIW